MAKNYQEKEIFLLIKSGALSNPARDRTCQFCLERKDEYHDDGMALHDGVYSLPVRMYYFECNESFEMIRRSRECVINLPTFDMIDQVIGIGNCSGKEVQKFEKFGLTALKGKSVKAPLIKECYANFECRLIDSPISE